MKCEMCQKREATVAYTQIVDDAKKILHLCPACLPQGTVTPAPKKESAAPLPEPVASVAIEPAEGSEVPPCPQCGMSYEEFRKMARFGCNRCYEAFEGRLERLFKRIHGSSAHTGKRGARKNASEPVAVEELSRLKDQLQLAVATEDYEEAAQLRDRIRRLESDVEQAR